MCCSIISTKESSSVTLDRKTAVIKCRVKWRRFELNSKLVIIHFPRWSDQQEKSQSLPLVSPHWRNHDTRCGYSALPTVERHVKTKKTLTLCAKIPRKVSFWKTNSESHPNITLARFTHFHKKWDFFLIFSSTVTTKDLIHMQSSSLDFHLLTCPSVNWCYLSRNIETLCKFGRHVGNRSIRHGKSRTSSSIECIEQKVHFPQKDQNFVSLSGVFIADLFSCLLVRTMLSQLIL